MKFTYNDHIYRVNWIGKSRLPNILLLGCTILNFKTLGIPGDIIFAQKTNDGKLKIVGKWGVGEIYEKHGKMGNSLHNNADTDKLRPAPETSN